MGKGDKHTFVGQFFEEVGHRILGGDLTRNEDGDICLWRRGTTVEVKSSGEKSSYGFRLSVDQIERYERLSMFPFSRAWYMLFAYRNLSQRDGSGRRSTELSEHISRESIGIFLAKSVKWCILTDFSIVRSWKENLPISTKSVMGHPGARTVDLKCRYAHSLMNGGWESGLKDLQLKAIRFGILHGIIRTSVMVPPFGNFKLRFPLTAVLPLSEILTTQRMLRRRGFSLTRGAL